VPAAGFDPLEGAQRPDFVTIEANPNDRDLRTPVGSDGDQVGQPRTVKHGADGIGNLHAAENLSAPQRTGPTRVRNPVVGAGHPTTTTRLLGTTTSSATRFAERMMCEGTNAPGDNAQLPNRSSAIA
jgi:hypothetical protein